MNGIIGRVDDKGALLNQQCIACLYALGADSGVAVSSRSVVKIIGIKDKFRIVRFIFRRALFAFSRLRQHFRRGLTVCRVRSITAGSTKPASSIFGVVCTVYRTASAGDGKAAVIDAQIGFCLDTVAGGLDGKIAAVDLYSALGAVLGVACLDAILLAGQYKGAVKDGDRIFTTQGVTERVDSQSATSDDQIVISGNPMFIISLYSQ